VTIAGLDIGGQLGGVVITETVFSLQGMGRQSVKAIFEQNLSIVTAVVLFAALFVVVSNILVDVLYALIDPRVKIGTAGH
jgi:peptide/nickel transport system permease protein